MNFLNNLNKIFMTKRSLDDRVNEVFDPPTIKRTNFGVVRSSGVSIGDDNVATNAPQSISPVNTTADSIIPSGADSGFVPRQGSTDSKGADGASNADSGVDENGSGVVGSEFSHAHYSPYFCSEHFEESPRDSTYSQAGQKRKKSESPANGGEALNEEGVSKAVRSRVSKGGGLGGVGGISSNGAGATNRAGEPTSSSQFDISPMLTSQDGVDQSKADLTKTQELKRLVKKIYRELGPLQPFWAHVNHKGEHNMSLRSSSKIVKPVASRESVKQSQEGQNPRGGFSAGRIRSSNVGGSSSNGAVAPNGIGAGGVLRGNGGKFSVEKSTQTSSLEVNSLTNYGRAPNPDEGSGAFGSRSSNVGGLGSVGGSSSSDRGGFSGVGGSSSNGAKGASSSNDVRAPNPAGGFSARRESSNVGGLLGGVGGSYSNGGVGGVDYRESGASAFTMFKRDDEFLNGVKNLEHLQGDSIKINQSRESHQQEAPSSSTASSSSSMPSSPSASSSSSMPSSSTASSSSSMSSSPTPSESPASTFGSSGLGGVNDKSNNAMGG